MAWVTTLGPSMGQIEYRLEEQAGCSLQHDHDREHGDEAQVDYRLDGADRPLEWIGEGLREVGIEPGSAMDAAGKDAARALADGRDPSTGEVLVEPKRAVDPRAKLPAAPLVEAVHRAAEQAGVTPEALLREARVAARFARMERGVARERTRAGSPDGPDRAKVAHRVAVKDLQRIATAAKLDLGTLYDAKELATARRYRDKTVVVGNRGYDLTLDIPKSYSVLVGMADPQLARQLEDAYLDCVRETVRAMEGWAGYGMRGHHGDGQRAETVPGTGMLGWMTVHRTARPVAGQAPDPHLHAHITIMNVVRGADDGQWRTIGAGGRDIHRHAHAADALLRARLRAVTRERWGIGWDRDPVTGVWEVVGVPEQLRRQFSKRAGQIEARIVEAGGDRASMSAAQQKQVAAATREAKQAPGPGGDLQAEWYRQARAAGVDPAAMVAQVVSGADPRPRERVDSHQVAVEVMRGEAAPGQPEWHGGLTAHRKVVTRADVLAAVMDAAGDGLGDLAEAEQLTTAVLADDAAVLMPPGGMAHLSNSDRYTSAEIVAAERSVLAAAAERQAGGYAAVPAATAEMAMGQFEAGAGFDLSPEQRAVIERLTMAGNGVEAVIGVAGAGKTTIMAALRAAHEAAGHTVAGAATAAVAAKNLQDDAGIESRTVAAWLARLERGEPLGVDVLVVDEAAMVDDRHIAALLAAAGTTTQVVMIGDPLQLKAVGVGGTFTGVHRLTGGLELTENRRQRDAAERAALATWRTGQRLAALRTWQEAGRIHATDTAEQARKEIVAAWRQASGRWADPYERIDALLMLAHRNVDVDAINAAVREALRWDGALGVGHLYQLAGGGSLALAVGDQVMTRTNAHDLGVLNGQRGIVTGVDDAGRVQITRREKGPDGLRLVEAWITPEYIAAGGVSHAYAITAAKAQGLTSAQTLVYGVGMEANVLYPAMSRDRERSDLWLTLDQLETEADRARLGAPAGEAERVERAVSAYAAAIEHDGPDRLVVDELDHAERDPAPPRPLDFERLGALVEALPDEQLAQPRPKTPAWLAGLAYADPAREEAQARQAAREELDRLIAGQPATGRCTREQLRDAVTQADAEAKLRASLGVIHLPAERPEPWQQRPGGDVATRDLAARIAAAEAAAARHALAAVEQHTAAHTALTAAQAGQGHHMAQLAAQREQLAERVATAEAAQAAAQRAEAIEARISGLYRVSRQAVEQARRATIEAQRNPIMLRLSGTSRAQLAAEVTGANQTSRQALADIEAARRELDQAQTQARGRHDLGPARAAAAQLDQQWPSRAEDAQRADDQAVSVAEAAAARQVETARSWRTQAVDLRRELVIREQMPPVQRATEEVGRTVADLQQRRIAHEQRQQAAQEAARDEAERVARDAYRYGYDCQQRQHDRGIDGPSL